MEKRLIPELRFKGFKGNWEEDKLKNISLINPSSKLPSEFNYVDLESVKGTSLKSHRKENANTAPSRAQRLASKGDIFYQTVRPYQKNNYYYNLDYDNFVFSTGYTQIRTKENFDGKFIFTYIQRDSFNEKVLKRCTGTSYPAINSNDLKTLKVRFPEIDEQEKIGRLFEKLDQTIDLQGKVLEENKRLKGALLQKLFPQKGQKLPELRLKGFSGDWEEKKLEDILTVNYGKDYSDLENGEIPVYGTGGIINYVNNYISNEDSVGLGRKGTINKPIQLKHPFWTVDTLFFIEKKEENSIEFIYNLLSIINWLKYNESTGVPSLSKKSIINVKVFVPKLKEQEAIGNLFRSLDEKIAREEERLEGYKTLKKSLLQKMFV